MLTVTTIYTQKTKCKTKYKTIYREEQTYKIHNINSKCNPNNLLSKYSREYLFKIARKPYGTNKALNEIEVLKRLGYHPCILTLLFKLKFEKHQIVAHPHYPTMTPLREVVSSHGGPLGTVDEHNGT